MAIRDPLSVIRSAITPLRGARILDVGCGQGGLARLLAAEGAEVVGVDPSPVAVSAAREQVCGAHFECAVAEALPFGDATFDAVVVMNTLHHVPLELMDGALAEAARVLRRDGFLIVIEPLASGSFFQALRVVEDESEVRLAAQQALVRAVAGELLTPIRCLQYVRSETFDDIDSFFSRIVAVEPSREDTIAANREAVVAHALAAADRTHDGRLRFDQPIKADIFKTRRR